MSESTTTNLVPQQPSPPPPQSTTIPQIQRAESMEGPPEHVEDTAVADYEKPPNSADDDDAAYYVNLPPGRMHATRVPERLSGSAGNLQIPPGLATILRRRAQLDAVAVGAGTPPSPSPLYPLSPRSRSRSPSLKEGGRAITTTTTNATSGATTTVTTTDANSSVSSLEDWVDQDILYDRAGVLSELSESDVLGERRKLHGGGRDGGFSNLTPVCERSTDDLLEDAHAFTDPIIVRSSNASRTTNSIGTGADAVLEPLNEDSEEDDLDDITEEDEPETTAQVIVTNLDNLTLEDDHLRHHHARDDSGQYYYQHDGTALRGTGESSLAEEAPSAPTA